MYLAEIGVKCPNCSSAFRSRQIPIIMDNGYRTSELRLYFHGEREQFEPYAVCTCPSCGHSDWATAFRRSFDETFLYQPNIPAHLQYRTAALTAERKGRTFFSIGQYYLYAAWCADDDGAVPQAREYRRLAIDAFRKSLMDGSCPKDKKGEIEYLIGELMRRSGDFQGASDYFRGAVSRLPGKFAMMARRLIRLAEQENLIPIDFVA
ncbi:MAG: DUF2225 domain-containing protein [Candidatus Melainabacteria bacterium]|nr:DUF2225 domain-containing protein [Candidatus Melainabacteria bacterium]